MEFNNNFYVGFKEKSTDNYAFEALIDPYTGDMYSEPGPNMMWNAKYGMMTGMMWGNRNATLEKYPASKKWPMSHLHHAK